MKYTLSDIANLAEIIAAVAIFISLIFVGVQLQENTRATMSATASSGATSAWYTALGNSEQSSALILNFMADPDALTPEQRFQIIMNLHAALVIFQNSYYLANEGTLDSEIHKTITEAIVAVKDQPGWKLYWQNRKSFFFTEFRV